MPSNDSAESSAGLHQLTNRGFLIASVVVALMFGAVTLTIIVASKINWVQVAQNYESAIVAAAIVFVLMEFVRP